MARTAVALARIARAAFDIAEASRPGARVVRGRLLEIAASATPVQVLGAVWSIERRVQPAAWPIAA
jgi:hypothetical protein